MRTNRFVSVVLSGITALLFFAGLPFSVSAASVTLTDECSSLTPPNGGAYSNFALDYNGKFQVMTDWNLLDASITLDNTVLDLKDGVTGSATATYNFTGASQMTFTFYMDGANFASQYSWGYSRGWEYMVGTDYKDLWGVQRKTGDLLPIDLSHITKIYRDPTNDKLYTTFATEPAQWAWYAADPRYSFISCAKPTNALENYGVVCEYSKDSGKSWTAVDYDITDVLCAKDPTKCSAKEYWYRETCSASFPEGVTNVRLRMDDVKILYEGTNGENPTATNNRNWDIALASVSISGTGPIVGTAAPVSSTKPVSSVTVSEAVSSAAPTASSDVDGASSSDVSASSDSSASAQASSSQTQRTAPGGLPVGAIVAILCGVVVVGAVVVVLAVPSFRRRVFRR